MSINPLHAYTPKYNLARVKPFAVNPKVHTNLEQFANLVVEGSLDKIAYWFREKENKNPKFKLAYGDGEEYTYKMPDFLCNALEIAIEGNQKDILDFFLHDPLVKDRQRLRGRKIVDLDGYFSFANTNIDAESKECVLTCIRHGVVGYPFEINFPIEWIDEAMAPILLDDNTTKLLKELLFCLDIHRDDQEGNSDEGQVYRKLKSYLKMVQNRDALYQSLLPSDPEVIKKKTREIDQKITRLETERQKYLKNFDEKLSDLQKQKEALEKAPQISQDKKSLSLKQRKI